MRRSSTKDFSAVAGFSLIELLVALALSTLIILGLYRLYMTNFWSYNLQEQLTDLHQNVNYVMRTLTDELMQAGASLPGKKYRVIYPSADTITIMVNRKGANYNVVTESNTDYVVLSDAGNFVGNDSLIRDSLDTAVSERLIIAVDTASATDTVHLQSALHCYPADVIYAASKTRFIRNGTNFCRDSVNNVIAENIDSLSLIFYDKAHAITTNWNAMRSAHIFVRGRTSRPDPGYRHPTIHDGYRRLSMDMDLRFRNRF
jgi:prepilin-type N-terminal cleavage/methylation domain-containing protein